MFLIMKNKLFLLILFIGSTIGSTYGQIADFTPDTVVSRAFYNLQHKYDTTDPSKIYEEDFILLLGKNGTSLYTSLSSQYQQFSLSRQRKEHQIQNPVVVGEMMPPLRVTVSRYTTPTQYYFNERGKSIYIREWLVRNYVYRQDLVYPTWEIHTDTATIHNILCYKATTNFMGRDWEAWFAPDLPFRKGPWLLSGLPGLIINARDQKEEVMFTLNNFIVARLGDQTYKITDPYEPIDYTKYGLIELPPQYFPGTPNESHVYVNEKEYLKLKEMFIRDPQGFTKMQMDATKGVDKNQEARMASRLRPKVTNPIDKLNQ
jgi:GLPGLI family protein